SARRGRSRRSAPEGEGESTHAADPGGALCRRDMRVARVSIRNYRAFDELELDLTDQSSGKPYDLVARTGLTGSGKPSSAAMNWSRRAAGRRPAGGAALASPHSSARGGTTAPSCGTRATPARPRARGE